MDHEFEWDAAKAEANLRKHGVSFETATEVFLDPFALESIDTSMDYGEQRIRITGFFIVKVMSVIYTPRGERLRIISARQATRHEHDVYYRESSQD